MDDFRGVVATLFLRDCSGAFAPLDALSLAVTLCLRMDDEVGL